MRLRNYQLILFFVILCESLFAQQHYRAEVKRNDGYHIVFKIEENRSAGKLQWTIVNDTERILINQIRQSGDSLLVDLPFFEALLKLKVNQTGYQGEWYKKTSTGEQNMPVVMEKGKGRNVLNLPGKNKDFSG
ncbi:MAG: hypothetical protein RLZZ420_1895, partial [Bacteroidota bacterium]